MLLSRPLPLSQPCPCGAEGLLSQCCGPYLQGQLPAPTAEKLMRSRYTAYATKTIDYLVQTHHRDDRQDNLRAEIAATANTLTWVGLRIIATQGGQPADSTGIVEFVALYQGPQGIEQLHERSRFIQAQSQWFYVDGDILPPWQPKKNEPCWCQGGKKFKQCHGKKRT